MPGLCLLSSFGNAEIIVSTRDRDVNLIEGVIKDTVQMRKFCS